jgi:hypothetical protein
VRTRQERISLDGVARAYGEAASRRDMNQTRTDLLIMAVIARAGGFDGVDYDELLVRTGYATAWGYRPSDCAVVYTPPAAPPWELDATIGRATGFGWEWLPKAADPEEAWATVADTLASGRPLQGRFFDDILIVGCRDAKHTSARRVRVLGGWQRPSWWTWGAWSEWVRDWGSLGRPTGRVPRIAAADAASEAMGLMARLAADDPRAGIDFLAGARFGLDGMAAYAAMLDDMGVGLDDIDRGWAGCHCVSRQYTGRRSAAAWLRRTAGTLSEGAGAHALAAARLYARAYDRWREYERLLSRASYRKPLPDLGAAWSDPARRHAAAAAVRRAAALEDEAAKLVRRALDA